MEIYIVDSSSESSFLYCEKDTPDAIQDETTSERSNPISNELSEMIDVNEADTSDNRNDKRIVVSGFNQNQLIYDENPDLLDEYAPKFDVNCNLNDVVTDILEERIAKYRNTTYLYQKMWDNRPKTQEEDRAIERKVLESFQKNQRINKRIKK